MTRLLLILAISNSLPCFAVEIKPPRVLDQRLKIELVAAEPNIVTPTGIAVDARGRVLCIESHTHFRADDYDGPQFDRIRMYEDIDGDRLADKITTFFDGTTHTMNLAVCHDGAVYVATRNEVFRLRDTDDDGKADERTQIVKLETAGNYPHNGLSGFAFDFFGNVYFGLGENLGASYKLVGTDGSKLSGGGEGGSINRCKLDGNKLERIATGFWNPFHLCLDTFGRLFAVDNDPDWRPPCRLLHIVPGGDYGYRYRLGRRGTHPFTSWFGKLPGTLGMVAGTGEAPSGIISYQSDNLPEDYRGDLLGTAWGVHAIERFQLKPRGATFESVAETIVKGDRNFRPVGIAQAPDGSLYISDWVDRSYKLHGKGRIWRLAHVDEKSPKRLEVAREAFLSQHRPLAERAARHLLADDGGRQFLREQLTKNDRPEVRALALTALSAGNDSDTKTLKSALKDDSPDIRALAIEIVPNECFDELDHGELVGTPLARAALFRRVDRVRTALPHSFWKVIHADTDPFVEQALRGYFSRTKRSIRSISPKHFMALVLRDSSSKDAVDQIPELLQSPDEQVRFIAARWIGEENLKQFEPLLVRGLTDEETSGWLFDAYLAAIEMLQSENKSSSYEDRKAEILSDVLARENVPVNVLVHVLRSIDGLLSHPVLANKENPFDEQRLLALLEHEDSTLRIEAIRTLRQMASGKIVSRFIELSQRDDVPLSVRAEAVASLSAEDAQSRKVLIDVMRSEDPLLMHGALTALRGAQLSEAEKQALESARETQRGADSIDRLLDPNWKPGERPPKDNLAEWRQLLKGGNPHAGARVFLHPNGARCYACHQINGRGGEIGPDLSSAGRLTDEQLLESIVDPSREIAPRFVPWTIQKSDGKIFTGIFVSESGEEEIYADDKGKLIHIDHSDMEVRNPSGKSIMPDGLVDQLTNQELRDLLAYLKSQK